MPSISAAWVRNNTVAAVVSAVASLAIYGMRQATGVAGADADLAGIAILFAVAIVLSAFAGIAYGVLTGAVLQRIVPMLPVRPWIGVNAGLAVIASVVSEISLIFSPGTGTSTSTAADDVSMGGILLVALIIGGILGAVIGMLQAWVLRKAALGTSAWVICSAAGFGVALVILAATGKQWEMGGGFTGELANQAIGLVAYVIMSLVMLPALRRLRDPMLSRAGPHFD